MKQTSEITSWDWVVARLKSELGLHTEVEISGENPDHARVRVEDYLSGEELLKFDVFDLHCVQFVLDGFRISVHEINQ